MYKYINKYKGEIITFISSFLLLLIVFFLVGALDNTVIISDMETQTFPLFKHLLLFLNGKTGYFNYNFGLGDSYYGIILYYLFSPFNILIFFIKNFDLLFLVIILLKSAFSSLFCYKYLKYHFSKSRISYLILFSLLYGLSSYFISYNFLIQFLDIYVIFPLLLLGVDKMIKEKKYVLYVVSLMFTILFNYYFAYMICIFLFLYFNYRILLNKMSIRKWLNKNITFIFISFFTCLSMSFVLLPVASEIGEYSRNVSLFLGGEPLKILFNFHDFFNYYLLGDFNDLGLLNLESFYLFTSLIILPLLIVYFFNKKIDNREKILTGIMFLILLISIGSNYGNYIWHGFVPPCCFNGRFTFMFILFTIFIAFKSVINISNISFKQLFMVFGIIYFIIFLYSFINYPRLIDIKVLLLFTIIYFTVIFISFIFNNKGNKIKYYLYLVGFILISGLFLLMFKVIEFSYFIKLFLIPLCVFLLNYLIRRKNISLKQCTYLYLILLFIFSLYVNVSNRLILGNYFIIKILFLIIYLIVFKYLSKNKGYILLLIFVVLELLFNNYNYLYRFEYNIVSDNCYEEVINYIKDNDDSLIYRIEDNYSKSSMNYPILYNYYGIDYFISTIKKDFVNFFIDLNTFRLCDSRNSIFYDGSYNLLSSLLNIKYFVDHKGLNNNDYTKIKSIGDYDIYKNEEYLNYGYMVEKDIEKINKDINGLEYINNIYINMSGNYENILDKVEVSKISNGRYSFYNSSDKDFYVLFIIDDKYEETVLETGYSSNVNNFNVSFNNNLIKYIEPNVVYKVDNKYEADKAIDIYVDCSYNNLISDVYVYYYNENVYLDDINILKENQFNVSKVDKDNLIGYIETNKDGILFLNCLYNEDLDIYVDGVKQDKIKLLDTFMGVYLDEGKHIIKLKYSYNIIYYSLIPSLIGIGSLLFIYYRKKLIKK